MLDHVWVEVFGQEGHQYVCLSLIGYRREIRRQKMWQDRCLRLTEPDEKYGGPVVLPFLKLLQSMARGHFLRTQEQT